VIALLISCPQLQLSQVLVHCIMKTPQHKMIIKLAALQVLVHCIMKTPEHEMIIRL
jgi:hypothetical protein